MGVSLFPFTCTDCIHQKLVHSVRVYLFCFVGSSVGLGGAEVGCFGVWLWHFIPKNVVKQESTTDKNGRLKQIKFKFDDG